MKKNVAVLVLIIAGGLAMTRAGLTAPISDTLSARCYDDTIETPCPQPGEPFYGQDGNYLINMPSFTKLDAGGNDLPNASALWTSVRDNDTGLIWEVKHDDDGLENYANPNDADNLYTWCDTNPSTNGGNAGTCNTGQDSESVIAAMNAVRYGGFSDWRLPTIAELRAIVDNGHYQPAVDTLFFPATKSDGYWSSSSYAANADSAWLNYSYSGSDYYGSKSDNHSLRAVRGGPRPSSDHIVVNGDGTVTDSTTGLMWQQADDGLVRTWEEALAYCENLSLAGKDDWRLPTLKELASIVDHRRYNPAADSNFFLNAQSDGYWSSTTHANNSLHAWLVSFAHGYGFDHQKNFFKYYARAVRGGQKETFAGTYFFPAIKDDDVSGWENYLTVQAVNPVPMDVTLRAYDMRGALLGTFIYSDTTPGANSATVKPNARVALRPSWIAGSVAVPAAMEGAVIVETSVPAIASTNAIANFYKGFSINEAAKPRQVHNFPKAYDGPDNYQVNLLVQNILPAATSVTVKLFGKTPADPGHGATRTYAISAHGTLKVRPSEVAPPDPATGKAINFSGSVVVYSDLVSSGDGLGPAIPAMCRFEAGAEALAIYESTMPQPSLAFPAIKDGKFGGALDYQNFVSVVNPSTTTSAVITMILYTLAGIEEDRITDYQIPPGGKITWRPSWFKGTLAQPQDFEGAIVVHSTIPVVGQTNTIYPGNNQYGADAFDLFESAIPAPALFFPKAYDNLPGAGTGATHLTDNFVYIQNPDGVARNIAIDLYNSNGTLNRNMLVAISPYATHRFRPKDLVTDGTGIFRGAVRLTETAGLPVTGAIKYEVHKTTSASSGIEAMSIYRSMGQ